MTTITIGKRRVDLELSYFRDFGTLDEFVAAQPSPKNKYTWDRYSSRYVSGNNTSWLGVPTIADVEKAVLGGWQEGIDKLQKISANEVDVHAVKSIKRRKVRADQGDEYDWQAGAQGEHDVAWSRTGQRPLHGSPVATIAIQIGGRCGQSPDQLFWRGAAALRLCDKLEQAGYSVNIIGVTASYGLDNSGSTASAFGFTYKLKDSKMPIDLNSLAAVGALSGFMRIFAFKAMASWPKEIASSFGTWAQEEGGFINSLSQYALESFGYGKNISIVPAELYSKEQAEEWVNATIEALTTKQ